MAPLHPYVNRIGASPGPAGIAGESAVLTRRLMVRDLISRSPPETFTRAPEAFARAEPLAAKLAVERGLRVTVERWPTGAMWFGVGGDADDPVPLVSLDLRVDLATDPTPEGSVN